MNERIMSLYSVQQKKVLYTGLISIEKGIDILNFNIKKINNEKFILTYEFKKNILLNNEIFEIDCNLYFLFESEEILNILIFKENEFINLICNSFFRFIIQFLKNIIYFKINIRKNNFLYLSKFFIFLILFGFFNYDKNSVSDNIIRENFDTKRNIYKILTSLDKDLKTYEFKVKIKDQKLMNDIVKIPEIKESENISHLNNFKNIKKKKLFYKHKSHELSKFQNQIQYFIGLGHEYKKFK